MKILKLTRPLKSAEELDGICLALFSEYDEVTIRFQLGAKAPKNWKQTPTQEFEYDENFGADIVSGYIADWYEFQKTLSRLRGGNYQFVIKQHYSMVF
jgi:hypothetical protein